VLLAANKNAPATSRAGAKCHQGRAGHAAAVLVILCMFIGAGVVMVMLNERRQQK
jgi:hypothetical protein